MEIRSGEPYPRGAIFDGEGTNFSVMSEVAERVELCLFDEEGKETRGDLPDVAAFCWHGYVPGVKPGQRYGFRVHGPWSPDEGNRCNPAKLLLDPYAKAVEGAVDWNEAVFAHRFGKETERDDQDSAPHVPRSIVIDPHFDWGDDRLPRTALPETIMYEVHLKGFTARRPEIPQEMRGTYGGFAHPASLDYLEKLGITAVEIMPVHQFVHRSYLLERGLRNYWGYDSIAFFAPHNEYSTGGGRGEQVQEFKSMVKALHAAGIEVILDVVYNHTAEGNHLGPTLCFKGIDNAAYYHLVPDQRRYYVDYTGTGNSVNAGHPHVLQLIMDSLRYWLLDMHVDGFRFDLAAALARGLHEVDRLSAFFSVIQQDPVISQAKLIAEPWDVGEGGYQVGKFPPLWSEWNGRYRDTVRDYWRGRHDALGDFASRFMGSSDLYEATGRRPFASINFVTAHDGFTLRDLVSYEQKRNQANGEENRDGSDDNRAWNCGAEGPTEDAQINRLRCRQQRNFLATLFLSQGVPMLLGGDECGRTQGGNNNPYCQDNETSWFDWESRDEALFEFTRRVIALRKEHPIFRRRRWFHGRAIRGVDVRDVVWFRPDASEMNEADWESSSARAVGIFLSASAAPRHDRQDEEEQRHRFYVVFNAHERSVAFKLPPSEWGCVWEVVLDTSSTRGEQDHLTVQAGSTFNAEVRSLVLLSCSQ
jgi:isoamylase